MAHNAGYTAIVSPRSGRNGGYYHCRPGGCTEYLPDQDRRAQQIRSAWQSITSCFRIEEELGNSAVYPGAKAFHIKKDGDSFKLHRATAETGGRNAARFRL